MPVPQGAPSIPYCCGHHVELRKKVASQAVGDLAGIDLVVLLLGCSNRAKHQWVSHLDLRGMWQQMIVDPAAKDRRLHRHHPWLGQSLHPAVQLSPGRPDLAFLLDPGTHVLHAVADRLLVYVQSDLIHISSRSLITVTFRREVLKVRATPLEMLYWDKTKPRSTRSSKALFRS
jgi:hypothetical protein